MCCGFLLAAETVPLFEHRPTYGVLFSVVPATQRNGFAIGTFGSHAVYWPVCWLCAIGESTTAHSDALELQDASDTLAMP